jgi:two-component system sensor histidine kinase KdpD
MHPKRRIHYAPTTAPAIGGDADALAQLLWILLENAVKHTTDGGNIWVAVRHSGQQAQIDVSDDGVGIPAGAERRIFDRFYQVNPARSGGAGLGLSIAEGIVRAHGGTIAATNNARGGASFVAALAAFSSGS